MRRRAAVRTLGQQARVWSVRVLLNLLVVMLLGAAFYGVYWATESTVELQVWRGLKSKIPGILGGMGGYVWPSDFRVLREEEAEGGDIKLGFSKTSESLLLVPLLPRSGPLPSRCRC